MKRFLWVVFGVMCGLRGSQVMAQDAGFRLEGIGSMEIPVVLGKMTNLVFPVDVLTAVKVSKSVLAQKVRGVENVIELKAVRRNFDRTNLSVYGKNGRLYSFVLRYSEDSSVLNFRVRDVGADSTKGLRGGRINDGEIGEGRLVHISGLPVDWTTLTDDAARMASRRGFLHISRRRERMRITLEGIYLCDSLEWMSFRLSNGSLISYNPSFVRFYSEDRKKVKRKAVQQLTIEPVYGGQPVPVAGETERTFSVGFTPFALSSDKRMVVELSEPDGGRVLVLPIHSKILLKARRG